jgi:hypothetical protein
MDKAPCLGRRCRSFGLIYCILLWFDFSLHVRTHAFPQESPRHLTRQLSRRSISTIQAVNSRRSWIQDISKPILLIPLVASTSSHAALEGQFYPDDPLNDPEIQELYNNPAIPSAPEEKSGLVVLRVAEVAQFQEKILRAIVNGDLTGVTVTPMQFAFGTQILLRNSNLEGNMKLMINEEIPKNYRSKAIKNAVTVMNTLQGIAKYSSSIKRDFEPLEMVALADMYLQVRVNLNELYEYLPPKEKDKYYGYFASVTEYEKKVANGTYNPELDGVLKFD